MSLQLATVTAIEPPILGMPLRASMSLKLAPSGVVIGANGTGDWTAVEKCLQPLTASQSSLPDRLAMTINAV